jgi:hypothetical protein
VTRALFFASIFAISCVAGVRAADEPFEATQIGKYDNTNSGLSRVTSVALSGSTIVGGTSSGGVVVWKMGTNGNVTKTATIPDGTHRTSTTILGLSGSIFVREGEKNGAVDHTDVYELGDDGSSAPLLQTISGNGAAIDGDMIVTSDSDSRGHNIVNAGTVYLYEVRAFKYQNVSMIGKYVGKNQNKYLGSTLTLSGGTVVATEGLYAGLELEFTPGYTYGYAHNLKEVSSYKLGTSESITSGRGSISGSITAFGVKTSSAEKVRAYEKQADGSMKEHELIPKDGAAGDYFGRSVAVCGSTIVVGAIYDDDKGTNSGSVYVFEKDADDGAFVQVDKLTAADGKKYDSFGMSVACEGSTIVVMASSGVYFYRMNRGVDSADTVSTSGEQSSTFEGTTIMQKIAEYSAEHDKVFARNQALTTEAREVRMELANLREKREALINMTVDDPPLPVIDMSALSVDNVTVGENATSGLGDAAASTSTDAVDLVAEFQKAHDKVIADTTELQKEIDYLRVKRGEIVDLMVGHTPVPVVDCGSDASAAAARGAALGETPATNSTLIMEYVADYQTKHDEVIEKTKVVKEEIAHVNAIRDKIIKLNPAITIDVTGHEATTASALGAALRFSSSAALRVGAPALALAAVAAVAGAALSKSRLDRRRRVGADEETLLVEGTKYGAVHA